MTMHTSEDYYILRARFTANNTQENFDALLKEAKTLDMGTEKHEWEDKTQKLMKSFGVKY